MRHKLTVALLVLVGLTAVAGTAGAQGGSCDFPYEAPDGTVIDEEPDSIAPGIASVSQTLWEMGINENERKEIVGLTSNSFYLEGSANYTDLGTTFQSNTFAENVIAQNTEIVINSLSDPDGLEEDLESAGIDYYYFNESADSISDIQRRTEVIGRLIGECNAADRVVNSMSNDVNRVEAAVEGRTRPTVLYSIPQNAFSVPGNGTFIGSLIETAGGKNAYDEAGVEGFTQITDERAVEVVSEQNPDWIVLAGGGPEDVPDTELYNSTTAVQDDQVLTVNPNYILQDAPRVTIPLENMARAFHAGAFENSLGGGSDTGGTSLPSGKRQTASVSVVEGTALASFGEGPVESVELGAEVEGEVTVERLDESDAPGIGVSRFSVTVPQAARDSPGTIRVPIEGESLNDAGVPPEDLVGVKLDGEPPTRLETTALETDTGATVVIDTPGYSEFAVVGSTPPHAVGDASVGDGESVLSATDSYDEYGEVIGYEWTVGGEELEGRTVDVNTDAEEATLTVTNDAGLTNETTVGIPVESGNETGEKQVSETQDGNVTDNEDGGGSGEETGRDSGTGNDTEGQGLPGFTAVAALVALAVAAFVRR
jgi:iron complex transport system substrate-binding protein